jgi:hypothetical protein
MRQRLVRIFGCVVLLCSALGTRAASVSGGAEEVFVPWKVLNAGDLPLHTSLVLFWIPGSREEIRRSDLLVSRHLAVYASQCIGMQIIRPEDVAMIEKFEAAGKLPVCILARGDGSAIARVGGTNAALRAADVEKMVREELDARDAAAGRVLDEARSRLAGGQRAAAIDLYRRVAAEQCLLPRKARDAQKALRKLGVEAASK